MFSHDVDIVLRSWIAILLSIWAKSGSQTARHCWHWSESHQERELGIEEDERDDHHVQMKRWIGARIRAGAKAPTQMRKGPVRSFGYL